MVHTIVCLLDDGLVETFAGLLSTPESLTDAEKRDIAARHEAVIDGEPGSHLEDARTISFIEVEQHLDPAAPLGLVNIFPVGVSDEDDWPDEGYEGDEEEDDED